MKMARNLVNATSLVISSGESCESDDDDWLNDQGNVHTV